MPMGPHQLCTLDSYACCMLSERRLVRLTLSAEENKLSMPVGQLGG
jgi:hypothetical protein